MVANFITIIRIILSILLLILKPFSLIFLIIYSICGFTDILDGYIARRLKIESNLGARLDTISDLIFFSIMSFILYPIIKSNLYLIIFILLILLIRIISIYIIFYKYKTFAILHTYGNKISGLLLFSLTYIINLDFINIMVYTVCTIILIFAIEELIINLKSKNLNLNQKSILEFYK